MAALCVRRSMRTPDEMIANPKRMLPLRNLILALAICALGSGCKTPSVFHSVSPNQPHAVLTSNNPPGFRGFFGLGRVVSPYFINGYRTSFWRVRDHFRIPPGSTVIDTVDVSEPYRYGSIHFVARAGYHYNLRPSRTNNLDTAIVTERSSATAQERVIASAFRNDD